ncbi:MAG: RNA 2',3'-cyclic phosphodiesterase [Ramlibacter sp.]
MAAVPPKALRLFIALWPPPPVRAALAALRDRWQWPAGAAVVEAARLHVTLHFLGSVATDRLPDLVAGLGVAGEEAELRLEDAQQRVWPGGIAVLELEAPPALRRLHARLAEALAKLGMPVEDRPWRPHVTFARKAAGARPAATSALPPWRVDGGFVLVRSVPGGGYETLQHYAALKG